MTGWIGSFLFLVLEKWKLDLGEVRSSAKCSILLDGIAVGFIQASSGL